MKIVIVGLGKMGQAYLSKLLELMIPTRSIIGVDINEACTDATERRFPGITVYHGLGDWLREVKMAIVATNAPSHCSIVEKLLSVGVKWVLCEKPIGLDTVEVEKLRQPLEETGGKVFTALLMCFSDALFKVKTLMRDEDLLMSEGSVVWAKNRCGDSRPTTGNLEEETVHGMTILHTLCEINQRVDDVQVVGALSFPHYTEPLAQQRARVLNPAFPLRVNASTMVVERIRTDRTEVVCSLHTSFIHCEQVRCVTAVLSAVDDPLHPVYAIKLEFNVLVEDQEFDKLTVKKLATDSVKYMQFTTDKLREQTSAFVTAALGGIPDKRLVSFDMALKTIAFTEAVTKSHQQRAFVHIP